MVERLPYIVIFYPVLLFSLSLHEAAHAWMSNRKGDSTARLLGRITLNPFPHMDLLGTVILPLAALTTGAPLFGWGKPVPVDSRYLKHPRQDFLWIAAMGPISNLCLALVLGAIGRLLLRYGDVLYGIPMFHTGWMESALSGIYLVCKLGVMLNLALAFFNLIPVFPLDGGSVLRGLLPIRSVPAFDSFSRYGMFILLFLFISGSLRFLAIPISVVTSWLLPL